MRLLVQFGTDEADELLAGRVFQELAGKGGGGGHAVLFLHTAHLHAEV